MMSNQDNPGSQDMATLRVIPLESNKKKVRSERYVIFHVCLINTSLAFAVFLPHRIWGGILNIIFAVLFLYAGYVLFTLNRPTPTTS
jgi:hypothetical protein